MVSNWKCTSSQGIFIFNAAVSERFQTEGCWNHSVDNSMFHKCELAVGLLKIWYYCYYFYRLWNLLMASLQHSEAFYSSETKENIWIVVTKKKTPYVLMHF
jgi:hypothetical protein